MDRLRQPSVARMDSMEARSDREREREREGGCGKCLSFSGRNGSGATFVIPELTGQ